MKTRFNTFDIVCIITELQKLVGMRVNNVYDIDSKAYLIRLQKTDQKAILLLESGNRIHETSFEWPKNIAPSGFSMKLRKHLRNKRLESLTQLGTDRIIDLQFGSGEAAYHIILELYDRGNIILTDYEFVILNVLRPHTEGDKVKFAVREKYPQDRARESEILTKEELLEILTSAKPGDQLKKVIVPHVEYGPALVEHVLLKQGFSISTKVGKTFNIEDDIDKVLQALCQAEEIFQNGRKHPNKLQTEINFGIGHFRGVWLAMAKVRPAQVVVAVRAADALGIHISSVSKVSRLVASGEPLAGPSKPHRPKTVTNIDENQAAYITQKREERAVANSDNEKEYFYSNQEFHPMLFEQHSSLPFKEFESFNTAVDEFFSSMESQKLELKAVQQEREAMKKLENVRKDHGQRLEALEKTQEVDKQKAELITRNQELVDKAILSIQTLLANQISWKDIDELVKEAANKGDIVAKHIRSLKLETNHISLYLTDPYEESDASDESGKNSGVIPSLVVDIDLALTTFANARRYYDKKRSAAKKQQKTIESQTKALKSAERKTKQTLKEVQTITNINKARKVFWFEKFYWFISSENYLVIAGRDQQQNELIVKRYLRPTDVYVHADIHGASSVIIKNPSGQPVPPKTLNEAGTMAICYSVAWDAKVITNAYWVWGDQVSKTAPTGEYLQTGSFMVRGKKNYLPPSHLILGLSFLFRVEDSFIEKHKGERKVLTQTEENALTTAQQEENVNEVELEILDESDEDEVKQENLKNEENTKDEVEEKIVDDPESEPESNFPDTHIRIQHLEGTKIKIITESKPLEPPEDNNITDENVFYLGDNKPVIINSAEKSRSRMSSESSLKQKSHKEKSEAKKDSNNPQQTKRGQKSKLKKIKEKYKDQDEEERKMRMEILQSSGTSSKDMKKSKKLKDVQFKPNKKIEQPRAPKQPQIKDQDDGEEDEQLVQADVDVINALTGIPLPDDELLFAIPVVAPYNTLSNYKFKVKVTPGTGKRGKAARTAVSIFLKDRTVTQREKDVLKAVKDEQLARNLPGKVKLSAPKMQIMKK